MHPDDQRKATVGMLLGLPLLGWLTAVQRTETLANPKLAALWRVAQQTPEKPALLAGALGGLAVAAGLVWLLRTGGQGEFGGAPFKRFLRGTRMVSASHLRRLTREKTPQVSVAGVPMPQRIEPLHLLVNGATGTGKSVLLRDLAYTAMLRGDRMIIVDPNGDMLSRFGRARDGRFSTKSAMIMTGSGMRCRSCRVAKPMTPRNGRAMAACSCAKRPKNWR